MSENTDTNTPETPASEQVEQPKPQTIQEVVSSIDISNVTIHDLFADLIGRIQQLATCGTINLGLASRVLERDAANAEATEALAADANAESAQ